MNLDIKIINDLFEEAKYNSSYSFESNIKESSRIMDWRNYVSSEFKTVWPVLTEREKKIIFIIAVNQAKNEKWDR